MPLLFTNTNTFTSCQQQVNEIEVALQWAERRMVRWMCEAKVIMEFQFMN